MSASHIPGGLEHVQGCLRERLLDLIRAREARIGVIGLGYVGLPLALAFSQSGFPTYGFDVDENKTNAVNGGHSYITGISGAEIYRELSSRHFRATTDFSRLEECDCIVICVPTPLSRTNDPDLSFIENAASRIRSNMRPGQLVVLESTTYPGCTEELLLPRLRESGLELDADFLLAFSPERVDPGNSTYRTANIPRVVGGCSEDSSRVAQALYGCVVSSVRVVSSARVAETAKLLENTFRAVNIGMVNELAIMCRRMNIDIWEVIDAAQTKPYGFLPFYPGPGIGGHCIPLDPAYLSWRGRQFGLESRFIELAEQINASMPEHVVELVADALNEDGKALRGSNVLVLGAAYKRDVGDVRESPAIDIIRILRSKKAEVRYHDPLVPVIDFAKLHAKLERAMAYGGRDRRVPAVAEVSEFEGSRRSGDPLTSIDLSDEILAESDCVVIVADHSCFDYSRVAQLAPLIVDTRNAIPEDLRRHCRARIVRL